MALLNPQGLTIEEMGRTSQDMMEQRVKTQAQASPGTLVVGGQSGNIPTGTEDTPVTFQAQTTLNAPMPNQGMDTAAVEKAKVVTSNDAEKNAASLKAKADVANQAQIDRDQAQYMIDKPAEMANQVASRVFTYKPNDEDRAATEYAAKYGASGGFLPEFTNAVNKIREQVDPQRAQMEEQQQSSQATTKAAEFKSGTAGTPFGDSQFAKLLTDQDRQTQDFNRQERDLLNKAWSSALGGNVDMANELYKQSADAKKNAEDSQAKALQTQKDALTIEKMSTDAADTTIQRVVKTGYEPTPEQLSFLDAKYGLDSGTSATLYAAAKIDKTRTDAKDGAEAQTAAVASAKALHDYLDSRPLGEPTVVGDTTYYGTGKGRIKTGLEISSKTGQGKYYEFNPDTGESIVIPMAVPPGFGDESSPWKLQQFGDDGFYWVNSDTRETKPVYADSVYPTSYPGQPGSSQTTNEAIYSTGDTGPALPGHEANAGQCGAACNYWYGKGVLSDKVGDKQKQLSAYPVIKPDQVQAQDTFLMSSGSTGHVGIVGDVFRDPETGKMMFTCTESNYLPPGQGKLSNKRVMSVDDPRVIMFARVPTPNLPPAGADSPVTQAASGNAPKPTTATGPHVLGASTPKAEPVTSKTLIYDSNNTPFNYDPKDGSFTPVKFNGIGPDAPVFKADTKKDGTKLQLVTNEKGEYMNWNPETGKLSFAEMGDTSAPTPSQDGTTVTNASDTVTTPNAPTPTLNSPAPTGAHVLGSTTPTAKETPLGFENANTQNLMYPGANIKATDTLTTAQAKIDAWKVANPDKNTDTPTKPPVMTKIGDKDYQWDAKQGKWVLPTVEPDASGGSQDQSKLNVLDDKLALIDSIFDPHKSAYWGFDGSVGAYALTRWTPLKIDKGARNSFKGAINQLISKETLDILVDLKARGGTLGALSEKELQILKDSASQISSWAILDANGKETGEYEIDKDTFKKELLKIRSATERTKAMITGEPQKLPTNIGTTIDSSIASGTDPKVVLEDFLEVYPSYAQLVDQARKNGYPDDVILNSLK